MVDHLNMEKNIDHPIDLQMTTQACYIGMGTFKPDSFLSWNERCNIIHIFNTLPDNIRRSMFRLLQDQRSFGVEIGKRHG